MKVSFSSLAIFIVAAACLLVDFSLKLWEEEERVIEWDVHSYYEYLPAYFIFDDIKFEKSDYRIGDHRHLFWPVYTDDGRKVIKMTMGTSYFYAPFFFVAHAYASVTNYAEDGFSEPYKLLLLLSTIFYLIIGLDFVRKILLRLNFSDAVIGITILLLGLGTNILCYASQSAPMSHIYSFCLFAAFIFYTIKWYEKPNWKLAILLGILFGWITLIRPTNSVIGIFFMLYGTSNLQELKNRISFFLKQWPSLILITIFSFLMLIPQLLYWKHVTGGYISYSYGEEGFFFSHPRILEGLFSWRKGWLVYTPLMAFALIGIFFLKDELKKFKAAIIVFMLCNIYIIFSWWCWWYGGTLGQRSLIESYALLSIPLAAIIQKVQSSTRPATLPFWGRWRGWLFCFVAVFFIWLNIFQTYQFEFHALHHDGMNKELYFKQFGKMGRIQGFDNMVHWPSYAEAVKGHDCETRPTDNKEAQRRAPLNIATDKKEVGRKNIQLKTVNGRFLCADEAAKDIIIANRDSAQGWETFTLVIFENKECAIVSHRNKFFTVEKDQHNELSATQDNISKLGTFLIEELDNNQVALKAANGKYLTVDEKSMKIFAKSDRVGEQEKFEMVILEN